MTDALPDPQQPKILAFLLPQFHAIPENDRWWGEGFTEWTNVKKAKSLFPGHRQPRIPQKNFYYNLLDPIVRDWQSKLAMDHGVYGFCYYHYWFNGKQLLQQPIDSILQSKTPTFPFCLAWANEPWTRTWDGGDNQVLMPQSYGQAADWQLHFEYLLRAFLDPRYIKVEGKPMFLIYRSQNMPQLGEMLALWRSLAIKGGLPGLHIVSMLTNFTPDARSDLADAQVEFEPMFTLARLPYWVLKREQLINKWTRIVRRLTGTAKRAQISRDYQTVWNQITRRKVTPNQYLGAFADWDNSPRKGLMTSMVLRNFDLGVFRRGIKAQYTKARQTETEFVFFNAWNEWAEGTYLEPDEANGNALLDIVAEVTMSGHRP